MWQLGQPVRGRGVVCGTCGTRGPDMYVYTCVYNMFYVHTHIHAAPRVGPLGA